MNLNIGDWVICFYGYGVNSYFSVFLVKVKKLKYNDIIGDYYAFGSFETLKQKYPETVGQYNGGLFPSSECIRLTPLHQQYAEITQTIPLEEIYKYERVQRRRFRKNSK